jgi:MYXO-CTERM domain-containing protein
MRIVKAAAVIAAIVLAASCGSNGCSCAQPIKGGYPVGERHEGAMQIRATQSLFSFLSQNGPTVLPKLLPTGATFNVPPNCGSNQICCAMPPPMCRLQFDFRRVDIAAGAPNVINLNTDFVLKTLDNLPVTFSGVSCNVSIDTTRAGSQTMNLQAQIALPVNQTTNLTGIVVNSDNVTGIDNGDVNLNESGSSFLCAIADVLFKGFVVGQLQTQVADQLKGTISKQACMKCMAKDDCNAFATDCKGGQCVDAMDNCVQELGLESKLDVGAMLSSLSPGLQASMDILAAAGGWSVGDTGLSLGMLGGARGDPHSSCVPVTTAPSPPPIIPSTTFFTNVLPEGATPYHLGIGVHVSELDSLGWGAFDGGALCLHIGTPTVPLLSTQNVGLIIPSLADLVHVVDAPVYLAMRPQKPPTFQLGKGTFNADGSVGEPLMMVSVPDFNIDFFVLVDDRYVRIMTLVADLQLPISLDIDQDGKLVPLLGDVGSAFTNLHVENSELLSESRDDLAKAFPTLLAVAAGNLTSGLKPIALPALMGLDLQPKVITTTDPDKSGRNQFLSIFADLAVAPPLLRAVDTEASLLRLELPPTSGFAVGARNQVAPTAVVAVSGRTLDGLPLEYSFRLDGGAWSPFARGEELKVRDPQLWLQGRHLLEVRARAVGLLTSLDATPAEVPLLVDTVAPEGWFDENGVEVQDRVSPRNALQFRAGDGPWSFEPPRLLTAHMRLQVRDEAGNVGSLEFHGRTTNPPSGGCNCDISPHPSAGWLGLLVVGALLFRRRLLLVFLLGCNSAQPLVKGDFESPLHEIGRYHDVAARGGAFHVSAYDSTGDLAYAHITDITKAVAWQYVDGIDPQSPVVMPGDYRHGVVEPGPDVGLYSSIALTGNGDPRIAYYDLTNGALKLAAGPHPWKISIVQSGDGANLKVGLYTQILLDGNDVPSIAYMATGISDGMGGFKSELRLATATGADASGESSWNVRVIDSTRISCAGLCPSGQTCMQAAMVGGMPNGDPAQSTCTATTADCNPGCAKTEACIMGACKKPLLPVAGDLPEGTGLFTQFRSAKTGRLLVYYDRSQGDLKLASEASGMYTVTTLDGGDPSTDRGQFASARLGDDFTLHVAYVDAISDRLLYLDVQAGTPSAPEVVDDGNRDDGPHSVGAGAALYVAGGSVGVVYQDQLLSDLVVAKKSGTWTHTPLQTGTIGFGWWPHVVSDGGKSYLTQFVYDRGAGEPPGNFVIAPFTP